MVRDATSHGPAPSLAVLLGRADDMRAELLVRMACHGADTADARKLEGTLVGPSRGRDMTLPTTVRLAALSPGGDVAASMVAAKAVFTEPAYWTPELPNLYRLAARLHDGGPPLAIIDRMIGLRRLGVRGRSLWLEGRRWVPRGVSIAATAFDPPVVRSLAAAAVIRDPSAACRAAADRAGVAIIARLEDAAGLPLTLDEAMARIAEWALHPSVMLVVVPRAVNPREAAAIAAAARPLKGTMLVGCEVDGTQPPGIGAEGQPGTADCLVVHLPHESLPHAGWRSPNADVPMIAQRAVVFGTAAEHRQGCDRLQAALAGWGIAAGATRLAWDWAGYLSVAW